MTTEFNVYEDDCLYKSFTNAEEARQAARFIHENVGSNVTCCKEIFGERIQVSPREWRTKILKSTPIKF